MRSPSAKPTFFWHGAFILLPLILLVGFGLWTARHDRLYAEQEEHRRAEVDAQLFVQDISRKLHETLVDNHWSYLNHWMDYDPSKPQGHLVTNSLGFATDAAFFNDAFDPSRKNYIGFYPMEPIRVTSTGEAMIDVVGKLVPLWPGEESHVVLNPNPFESVAELLGRKESRLAKNSLRALVGMTNKITASGIRIGPAASLLLAEVIHEEAPELAAEEIKKLLNSAALESLRDFSEFSPLTVDRVSVHLNSWLSDLHLKPIWRDHLLFRENAMTILKPILPRLSSSINEPKSFWIEHQGVSWLILSHPMTYPPYDAIIEIIPEALVQESLFAAALLSTRTLPHYEGLIITMGKRDLVYITNLNNSAHSFPKAVALPSNNMAELGRAETSWPWARSATDTVPGLSVSVVVANPHLWHQTLGRRQAWLISLILVAGIISLIGFFSARRAFLQQQRLNEAQSNFVSSVSHELRAPIASVRLMAESLERDKISDPARKQEYFRYIVQECRRLSTLIENVLDLSRIDQDRKNYVFEACDFRMLVEQTVQLMTPYAVEKGVTLSSSLNDEIPNENAFADGHALQQALINLMDNAIKHSPRQGKVVVDLSYLNMPKTNSAAQISVTDNGPGIPASEQIRIFEKFYRLGSELRRETEGIGIGLSIVKHVVEAHGGKVLVKSTPGEGSRFTMEVPLQPPSERNTQKA